MADTKKIVTLDLLNDVKNYIDAQDKVNSDAIEVLNGAATETGSVANTVATEVAKIVAGADENFDTLKEVADWIAADTTRAAELTAKVSANETAIGKKASGDGAATGLHKDIADLAARIKDVEDDSTVADDLATLEGNLKALAYKDTISNTDIANDAAIAQSKIAGLADSFAGKVDVVEGKGLSANDFTDAYKGQLDNLDTTYDAYGSAQAVSDVVGTLPAGITATTVVGYIDEKVGAVQETLVYATSEEIKNLFK